MRNTLFTLSLILLAACSGESAEQHIARARAFIGEANYQAAAIELQNALQQDIASAEARWLLGLIHLETGEILAAENQLLQARQLGWPADDVQPALAEAQLAQGKNAEVIALDVSGLAPAAAARLLSTQAVAHALRGEFDAARAAVAAALRENPRSLDAALAEATVTLQAGDADGALVLAQAILDKAPDNGEAWWLKGHALFQSGRMQEAREAVDRSIALLYRSVEAYLTRALINLQLQDYAAAQADSQELKRLAPRNPTTHYVNGLLRYQQQDYRGAITSLTLAEPIAARFPAILFYLCKAHLADKNLGLAVKFAQQFVALAPQDSNGRKLLAALLVQQDKPGDARVVLQPVLDQHPDDIVALNIMANALLLDDRADVGIELYARIMRLQPQWRVVPLKLESRLLDTGETGASTAPGADNFPQDAILLILNHLAKQDFQGAIDAAKDYQFRDLENLAPSRVLGMVYLAAGQPDAARETFNTLLKREPGDVLTNLSLAQMALRSGDADAARAFYQTALDSQPDDLTTLLQLSALEGRAGDEAAMVARLQEAITAHPAALEPRLKLAGHYLVSGKPGKVEPVFAPLDAAQREAARVLELTALAQLAQQQYDRALATARALVKNDPDDAHYRVLLAKVLAEAGDGDNSKQELMAAVERDPNYVPALLNLAAIAQRQGSEQEFERHLAALVKLAPEDAEVLRLRALSANAKGNTQEALALLQQAHEQAPTSQSALQLSALHQATGDNEAARKLLQAWLLRHPYDTAARLALAFALELGNDMAGAKAQYLAVLEQDADNVAALNNLAWNLRHDNPQRALDYSRRATALAPDQSELLDTLAVIEHIGGDNAGARRSIQRALALDPDNSTLRYHLAMIDAALGDTDAAITTLRQLLAEGVATFPERAEAEQLLASLSG